MSRPGFVLTTEARTPRLVVPAGQRFVTHRFDAGTHVLYPAEVQPLRDPRPIVVEAIDGSGLAAEVRAAKRLTLLVTDGSHPAPPARHDVRRVIAERLCELAAEAGVDDVALVVAGGARRRPTDEEVDRLVGERVARSFRAVDALTVVDVEDAGAFADLGAAGGVSVRVLRRLVESDLVVALDVLAESPSPLAADLRGYAPVALGAVDATTARQLAGATDPLAPAHVAARIAERVALRSVVAVLGQPVRTDALRFLSHREWEWGTSEKLAFAATQRALKTLPKRAPRTLFANARADYPLLACFAGEPGESAVAALGALTESAGLAAPAPADVLLLGVAQPSPIAPSASTNPLVAAWDALARGGYASDPRLLKHGGTLVAVHPLAPAFSARHHSAAADLFARELADPDALADAEAVAAVEERYAHDPWLIELYRHRHSFHPLHALQMWRECQPALAHAGEVIWVGAKREQADRLGGRAATRIVDALEMARSSVDGEPSVTYVHATGPIVITGDK